MSQEGGWGEAESLAEWLSVWVWAAPGVDDDYSGVSGVVAAAGGAEPRGVRPLCRAGLTVVRAVGSLLVVMGVGDLSEGWRRCGSS